MRVAINLLTDDPRTPSGAHWFWKQVITEMVPMLAEDEELPVQAGAWIHAADDGDAVAGGPQPGRRRSSYAGTMGDMCTQSLLLGQPR